MSETILGISGFCHASAAAIVYDGEIIAAAQEERFSRRHKDSRFPRQAIDYCLEKAFIEIDEVDAVVFYCHPEMSFDRLLKSVLATAPHGEAQWLDAASDLSSRLLINTYLRRLLGIEDDIPLLLTHHHLSLAAAAFFPSPFEEAAILTLDNVGEWASTGLAMGRDRHIEMLAEIHHPHSLGLLYGAFVNFCGFESGRDESKLMDLAAFGEARYADTIRQHLVEQKPDGSFRLATEHFRYLSDGATLSEQAYGLFAGPPRQAEQAIGRREMDLAASIQHVTEEIIVNMARHLWQRSGSDNLCLAGSMTLNAVANGVLQRQRMFERIWIQPAGGAASTALGAALDASHRHFHIPRRRRDDGQDSQRGNFLGPAVTAAEIRAFVDRVGAAHHYARNRQSCIEQIVEALEEGKVVGFYSGPMEVGPHGLGSRTILADPRRAEVRRRIHSNATPNRAFRPLGMSILAEKAAEYLVLEGESPYMLLAAPLRPERRLAVSPLAADATDADRLATVDQARSEIPAVTHVDYSVRVHTVRDDDNADFHALLTAFEQRTGCPMLASTPLRLDDEPIVSSPEDAYVCFMRSDMDLLALEDCLLVKEEQTVTSIPSIEHLNQKPLVSPVRRAFLHGFHGQRLVPLANRLQQKDLQLLGKGSSQDAETWYQPPSDASVVVATDGSSELVNLWRQQGLEEMADLMPDLLSLAKD